MLPEKIERVLVIGSWAKEQITIENISKKPSVQVFSYMSTKNPGIISLVNDYMLGALDNKEQIVDYAVKQKIDLVLITTAQPLSVGVVDALQKENIFVFGPSQNAARLESDKAYTRQLLKKHGISVAPIFNVFTDHKQAVEFAQQLKWNVAVKPIGLTEGLGVKIFGDQLKTKDDVIQYIFEIFDKKIGGHSKVLIEEKLVGTEFAIQCLVYKKNMISTPAVQDYKRLLPGDQGPNTASMGSISENGFLLPFMTMEDYDEAVSIITKTIDAYYKETGEDCNGFLYGQFIKTTTGIHLVEYNFRPGDPEWLNTMFIMHDNILEVIEYLIHGVKKPVHFEEKATVCKYIVPKGYPHHMDQVLAVNFDEKKINDVGVKLYYSSGLDSDGRLRVGSERGIAFISKAETVGQAAMLVEKAISMVSGDFHYRSDIGTKEMIRYH